MCEFEIFSSLKHYCCVLIKKRKYKVRIIIKITIGIRNNNSDMKTYAIKQLIIENKLIKAGFN
jgi:hypothetical protein